MSMLVLRAASNRPNEPKNNDVSSYPKVMCACHSNAEVKVGL